MANTARRSPRRRCSVRRPSFREHRRRIVPASEPVSPPRRPGRSDRIRAKLRRSLPIRPVLRHCHPSRRRSRGLGFGVGVEHRFIQCFGCLQRRRWRWRNAGDERRCRNDGGDAGVEDNLRRPLLCRSNAQDFLVERSLLGLIVAGYSRRRSGPVPAHEEQQRKERTPGIEEISNQEHGAAPS